MRKILFVVTLLLVTFLFISCTPKDSLSVVFTRDTTENLETVVGEDLEISYGITNLSDDPATTKVTLTKPDNSTKVISGSATKATIPGEELSVIGMYTVKVTTTVEDISKSTPELPIKVTSSINEVYFEEVPEDQLLSLKVSTSKTFNWNVSKKLEGRTYTYDVELKFNDGNFNVLAEKITEKSYTLTATDLENPGVYQIRITPYELSDSVAGPSATYEFQVANEAGLEGSFSPANGTKGLEGEVIVSWGGLDIGQDTNVKYNLFIGKGPTNLAKVLSETTKTNYSVFTKLNEKYYWQVEATNGETSVKSDVFEFWTKGLEIYVSKYNSGPIVQNAKIQLLDGNTVIEEVLTNANGYADINYPLMPKYVDIKISKDGHALTKIIDVKPEYFIGNKIIETQLREASIRTSDEYDGDYVLNDVSINYYKNDDSPVDITLPATEDFYSVIEIKQNTEHQYIAYGSNWDRIPGSSTMTSDRMGSFSQEATKMTSIITLDGLENGMHDLNTVIFDHNDNLVQKIDYFNVQRAVVTAPANPYKVMKANEFEPTYDNLTSWTKRRGVGYYNNPVIGKSGNPKDLDSHTSDSNLYIELYWVDWDTYSVLIDPNEYSKPEGYNIYRSFNGENFEKIAMVRSDYVKYRVAQASPMANYIDKSPELTPEEEVWYKVSPVYNNYEGEKVLLGSVVPMKEFNVELKSPEHNSSNVSVNPTFTWGPDKALTSDSTVVYEYQIFVYDWNQSDNGLMIPFDTVNIDTNSQIGKFFTTEGKKDVSVQFTGNNGDIIWNTFNPYSLDSFLYPEGNLEHGKSYNWGVNVAYAYSFDEDSSSYSLSADFRYRDAGWWFEAYGIEPDLHADFTTETEQ